MLDAVVNDAVTPELMEIVGEIAPEYNKTPDVVSSAPIPKNVAVPEPAVHGANVMAANGDTEFEVTVQPAELRATATRAYVVYEISLEVCVPEVVGSAVCRDTNRLPAVELPRRPVTSPTFATGVLLNTSNKSEFPQANVLAI